MDKAFVTFLKEYVLHWKQNWQQKPHLCEKCPRKVYLWDIEEHGKLCDGKLHLTERCKTCLMFKLKIGRFRHTGVECPFSKLFFEDIENFERHLKEYATQPTSSIFLLLNRGTAELVNAEKTPDDIRITRIIQFISHCKTTHNSNNWFGSDIVCESFRAFVANEDISTCPLCLLRPLNGDFLLHLTDHIGGWGVNTVNSYLVSSWTNHCFVVHYKELFKDNFNYLQELRRKASFVRAEPIYKTLNMFALNLDELQVRFKDPPYEKCCYCAASKAIFLNQIVQSMNVVNGRFRCSLQHCSKDPQEFESFNLLIRHFLYTKTALDDQRSDRKRVWGTDKLLLTILYIRHCRSTCPKKAKLCQLIRTKLVPMRNCIFCRALLDESELFRHLEEDHGDNFRSETTTFIEDNILGELESESLREEREKILANSVSDLDRALAVEYVLHRRNNHARDITNCTTCKWLLPKITTVYRSSRIKYNICPFCGQQRLLTTEANRYEIGEHIVSYHDKDVSRNPLPSLITDATTPEMRRVLSLVFVSCLQRSRSVDRKEFRDALLHRPQECQICFSFRWDSYEAALDHFRRHKSDIPCSNPYNEKGLAQNLASFYAHCQEFHCDDYLNKGKYFHEGHLVTIHALKFANIDPPYATCNYCTAFRNGIFLRILALCFRFIINPSGMTFKCFFAGKCAWLFESPDLLLRHLIFQHNALLEKMAAKQNDELLLASVFLKQPTRYLQNNDYASFMRRIERIEACPICLRVIKDEVALHLTEQHSEFFRKPDSECSEEKPELVDFYTTLELMKIPTLVNLAQENEAQITFFVD